MGLEAVPHNLVTGCLEDLVRWGSVPPRELPQVIEPRAGTVLGSRHGTKIEGSHRILVTVRGRSPVTDCMFVRKELVSVLVHGD